MPSMPGRAGFVLVAALVALVVIALIITGAFYASGQELSIARNELRDQQALAYAEYAASHAIAGWDSSSRAAMIPGQTAEALAASNPPFESTVYVTKLDTALYAVVAEARIAASEAYGLRRRVGVLVRTVRGGAGINPPVRVSEQAWSELY
jgi:type II secretory pathway pseudopilin PulG